MPSLTPEQLDTLRRYSAGELGTRDTIERAGLDDYADLIIALVQHDLDLPRPADTPARGQCRTRARDPAAASAPWPLKSP